MMTRAPVDEKTGTRLKIPTWAGPAAILLCLLGAGWFVWWYLFGSIPRLHTVTVDPAQVQSQAQANMQQAMRRATIQPRRQGVTVVGKGQWLVRSATGTVQ